MVVRQVVASQQCLSVANIDDADMVVADRASCLVENELYLFVVVGVVDSDMVVVFVVVVVVVVNMYQILE